MAVGMTTVFAFLGLLVGLMQASAALFASDRFAGPEPPAGAESGEEEIAVVLAAIELHRRGGGA